MLWAEVRASVRFSCWNIVKIIKMFTHHIFLLSKSAWQWHQEYFHMGQIRYLSVDRIRSHVDHTFIHCVRAGMVHHLDKTTFKYNNVIYNKIYNKIYDNSIAARR